MTNPGRIVGREVMTPKGWQTRLPEHRNWRGIEYHVCSEACYSEARMRVAEAISSGSGTLEALPVYESGSTNFHHPAQKGQVAPVGIVAEELALNVQPQPEQVQCADGSIVVREIIQGKNDTDSVIAQEQNACLDCGVKEGEMHSITCITRLDDGTP